ncbi:class I SAM-dependent methyltransferase [Parasediminibacterium paludis]|uniref:Class I SAM-dependent methyltransferase n=1 Tax=Parasediminibacterium paludis TaxID=908966 RepID=A0ABV8PYE1_9BACT
MNKYDVKYYQCTECDFIQTEKVFWLNEAYSNAITFLDIGLIYRNEVVKPIIKSLAYFLFKNKGKYIDYGGGYGMLVRMMRDSGLDYYRQDLYCENLFAKYFDVSAIQEDEKHQFNMLTAFEVFEHLDNPIFEIEQMFKYSDTLFFSTLIIPKIQKIEKPSDWWYFIPETGQHIALYSIKSLEYIAKKYDYSFYTNGINYHMFTKKPMSRIIFKMLTNYKVSRIYNTFFRKKSSLLMNDFNFINNLNK